MIATTTFGETAESIGPAGATAALPEFSLVAGGPLYRIMCRLKLADSALGRLDRRILVALLIAWLPLLVLTMAEGYAWSGVKVAFIPDGSLHLRLLLALPLMLAAESVIHDWMRSLAGRFIERDIIVGSERPRFAAAVAAAHRLRDSVYPELIIALAVLGIGTTINWHRTVVLQDSTWFWVLQAGAQRITFAGWWAGLISLPLFQFFLFRWYFRLFIWAQFLWRVARLQLKLVPTQPDRAGGLGFIGSATEGFWVMMIAHGTIVAAVIVHGMLFGGMTLPQYKLDIYALWAVTLLWVVVPLLPFAPVLHRAKRAGKNAYGNLSQRYAIDFEQKWMSGAMREDHLLGSGDIQSLADLRNGYDVVRTMRLLPIGRETVLRLLIFPLIPVAPLALTLVPLDRLVKHLISALF
jgi:hypothetical protein